MVELGVAHEADREQRTTRIPVAVGTVELDTVATAPYPDTCIT